MLFAAPVFAQSPSTTAPPVDRRNTERIRQQEMSRREWQLRNFGNEPEKPKDKRQIERLMLETEEDFNRILTLHNEIVRAISSDNTLDYGFVSEASGEIQKRATRVQSNLQLRLAPEEIEELPKLEEVEIKAALIKLCNQIRGFVTNPTIENPNAIDAEQFTRARRDLETLIQLSGLIKRDADKLSKDQK
jgi:hypothetical protein